jgi:hypothetical protein
MHTSAENLDQLRTIHDHRSGSNYPYDRAPSGCDHSRSADPRDGARPADTGASSPRSAAGVVRPAVDHPRLTRRP